MARGVIRFDISSLQVQNTILKATLSLYATANNTGMEGKAKNGEKSLYFLLKDWKEADVTWQNPWNKKGGDYEKTPLIKNTNAKTRVWEDFDVTEAVKGIASGKKKNYGFCISADKYSPAKGVIYISSNSPNANKRPKLTILYDEVTAISHEMKKNARSNSGFIVSQKKMKFQSLKSAVVSIQILNVHGKIIFSIDNIRTGEWFSLSDNLGPGLYIARAWEQSSTGIQYSNKFYITK